MIKKMERRISVTLLKVVIETRYAKISSLICLSYLKKS